MLSKPRDAWARGLLTDRHEFGADSSLTATVSDTAVAYAAARPLASSREVGRRALSWALATPIAAAGVLVTHALAYRLTGARMGQVHEYLAHAPQVVFLLASLALLGLALQERSLNGASVWWFAPLAPLGFAAQEHVERLAHTGELPWLLTSPTFLLGLALQLPVALVCVLVVRRVGGSLATPGRARRWSAGEAWLPLPATPAWCHASVRAVRPTGRGPPALLAV